MLRVPVLRDPEAGETANGRATDGQTGNGHSGKAERAAAAPPAERAGTAPPAAPPEPVPEDAEPSLRRPGGTPAFLRVAGFVALLAALAFAGVVVGRLLRGGGDGSPVPPATSATTTTRARTPVSRSESWGPLTATPAGRLARPAAGAAAALSGTRLVVLGGAAGNAVQAGAVGGVLRPVASLPSARAAAAAFAGDGAVFLIGGEHGTAPPSDQILRFDLASRKVTPAGSFIEPLAGAGYVQSGGSWLLAGGWTGTTYATAVLRVAPDGTATLVARLPEALRDPAVALLGGKLYVAGGRRESGPTDAVYVVELASGTVSVLGRLPRAVYGASLAVAGGQLYLLGGRTAAGPVATVVHIDPGEGKIAPAGRMPRPLAGAATVRAAGSTLVIGGTRPTAIFRLGNG